jgi:hypothetical protein
MPNDLYKIGTFNTPAQASSDMRNFLSNNTNGRTILSAAAYPKRNFPTTDNLGLKGLLDSNAIFPFKNNSVALTDIEVPTTIVVLAGAKQNEIKYQTNKFILQSIIKPLQERFQIIETFGEPALYFYDKRTRIYTIQGLLFDAEDPSQLNNPGGTVASDTLKGANYWATAFQDFYDRALRGTVLAQKKWIAALYVNNWYIKGYPLNLTISKTSEALPQTVSFQMTWAIKSETLLSSQAARALWSKNRLSKDTIDAYNEYLGALSEYTAAYDAYAAANAKTIPDPDNIDTLLTKREKAANTCRKAMEFLEIALAVDAEAFNIETPNGTKR